MEEDEFLIRFQYGIEPMKKQTFGSSNVYTLFYSDIFVMNRINTFLFDYGYPPISFENLFLFKIKMTNGLEDGFSNEHVRINDVDIFRFTISGNEQTILDYIKNRLGIYQVVDNNYYRNTTNTYISTAWTTTAYTITTTSTASHY